MLPQLFSTALMAIAMVSADAADQAPRLTQGDAHAVRACAKPKGFRILGQGVISSELISGYHYAQFSQGELIFSVNKDMKGELVFYEPTAIIGGEERDRFELFHARSSARPYMVYWKKYRAGHEIAWGLLRYDGFTFRKACASNLR